MGNRITRLAYSDECAAAVRAVVAAQGRAPSTTSLASQRNLWAAVHAELRGQGLGMPPGVDRAGLAETARDIISRS